MRRSWRRETAAPRVGHAIDGALVIALALVLGWEGSAFAGVTPHTVWTPEARAAMPSWVQVWIPLMFVVFGAGLLFVRRQPDAWWMVGAFVVSHVFSGLEVALLGADRLTIGLIAVNHVLVWTPAAVCFARRTRGTPPTSAFGLWRFAVLATAGFSLVFDYRDAWLFLTTVA